MGPEKPFRLGIAGRGFMGSKHRGVLEPGDVELAGASDWRELVDNPDLDAIDICLPTDLHAEVTVEALARGKHVFCEKPMALTTEDCACMMLAAEKHHRVLMIGQVLRFWPEYLTLARFVSLHRRNVTSAVFCRRSALPDWGAWLADEERSGGAILDLMIHDIDQALLLFGTPEWVSARSLGPLDTIDACLQYSDSFRVQIQGGWFPAGTDFHMDFAIAAGSEQLTLTSTGGDDAYRAELKYFVECARANKPAERCLPTAAADAVRLALLLKESRALNGTPLPCVL